ncbi:MAG TPA: protein-disulfide reductase DsbD domain-containing protein [Chitinophagaceae bacterium]|nr:protein-disulfide reductase DsbD domain-containing protein [Chitinophagaceae bacterium]
MKKLSILILVLFSTLGSQAQLSPVTWSFSATKVADKTYEIHMQATIQNGWHLYSQKQPDDAIAIPTAFTIRANPLFKPDGKIKEIGKMELMKDAELGISANQYSNTVDFVQKIKLKSNVKTNFNGSVEYQTCDDKKCLPAKKINFSVAIK